MPSLASLKRITCGLAIAFIPLLVILIFLPANTRSLRLGILVCVFGSVLGSVVFAWKRHKLLCPLLGFYLLVGAFLLLPGRPLPGDANLQKSFIASLEAYEGVPYIWGGESCFGLDCSGLVRKAFENTLFKEGLLTLNPALVRGALDLWWNDTTAEEIGKGYEGRTLLVTECPSLNGLDHSLIQPGDLAVTSGGAHVMAYLGENQWIGADPGEQKVTVFTIPERSSSWFAYPMKIVRWRNLKE